MLGRVFGRRNNSPKIPPHPGPDADGVARIIPKEVFEGETGAFLRQMGFSPDEAANMMPTQASVQAKADRLGRDLDALVDKINTQLSGGLEVIPWALIPYSVWHREPATFLMVTCDFYPASRWNTMLLPANSKTAAALGLPEHPRVAVEGLEDAAVRILGELHDQFQIEHDKVGAALARGDTSLLATVTNTQKKFAGQVVGIAHVLGSKVFGDEAWQRHDELFAAELWR